jgi:Glycosyl hydrolase family 26
VTVAVAVLAVAISAPPALARPIHVDARPSLIPSSHAVPQIEAGQLPIVGVHGRATPAKAHSRPRAGAPPPTTTTTLSPSTTTSTARTETTSPAGVPSNSTVTSGDGKAACIEMNNPGGLITDAQLAALSATTGVSYNCVETYETPAPQWGDWDNPWPFRITSDGWDAWLKESPVHQVILGMDLIPAAVSDNNDPLTWEQPCDEGQYAGYATTLAHNLVGYGAANTVIRLGVEANGQWTLDYVGQTTLEELSWAQCFDNEVTAMRSVPGSHFLFVWNPNTCTNDLGLANWYPGNSYVDIIGADAYDTDCNTLKSVAQEGWSNYYIDSNPSNDSSLSAVEAFSVAQGKALAIPEWGLTMSDDPAYVNGIASMVNTDDVAFQSYFDCGCDSILPLGRSTPNATAAYGNAFG